MRNRVTRDGLGYRLDSPDDGVSIRADRLRESSGEVTVELTVERAPDGHLLRTRFNLLSTAVTKNSLAKALGAKSNHFDWGAALEELALGVLALEREGEPWVKVGRSPQRERPPFLLEPWLFENAPTILFGGGGLGKSTAFASAIVVALTTGHAPLPGWHAERTGPVLILDWEGDADDWNDSIAAVCAGMGIEAPEVDYRACRGPLDTQVEAIAAHAAHVGAVAIVVDSAERAMRAARESGSDDPVKRFYDALRQIPTAALVIDHVSKSQLEHGGNGGPIGSVAKYNAARLAWELVRARKPDEDGTRHLVLHNRKMSKAPERPSVGVAVIRRDGVIRMWEEAAVAEEAPRKPKPVTLWERIRALLAERAGGMPVQEIVGALGIDGKDPMRIAENAMARHTDVFGHTSGSRLVRDWYVLDDAPETEDANVLAFPGSGFVAATEQREHPRASREHARVADMQQRADYAVMQFDAPADAHSTLSEALGDDGNCIENAYSASEMDSPIPLTVSGGQEHDDPRHSAGPSRGGGTRGERHTSAAASGDEWGVRSRGATAPLSPESSSRTSLVGSPELETRDATRDLEDPFA